VEFFMKKLIVASICLLLNQASFAASADAGSQLKAELENIKTFSAEFDQRIVDAGHKPVSRSNGSLSIRRPGAFYWEGKKPDPILVVADGKTLWTYDIELEQVTKQPVTEALDNTPAALLAGDVNHLERDFKISFGRAEKCVSEADTCFHLDNVGLFHISWYHASLTPTAYASETTSTLPSSSEINTQPEYTVKKGDTLWDIAENSLSISSACFLMSMSIINLL